MKKSISEVVNLAMDCGDYWDNARSRVWHGLVCGGVGALASNEEEFISALLAWRAGLAASTEEEISMHRENYRGEGEEGVDFEGEYTDAREFVSIVMDEYTANELEEEGRSFWKDSHGDEEE